MPEIRVAIADDHAILRSGLKLLIDQQPDMSVVGEAHDWVSALQILNDVLPDVMTIDLTMPGGDAFYRLRQLRQVAPTVKLLVLTMHDDEAYLRGAISAGADGYVLKASADRELMTAIRAVMDGKLYTTLELHRLNSVEKDVKNLAAIPEELSTLSHREMEVLRSAARGLTNREIAEQLFLSVKTVESYRARLMSKLRLKSRADLVQLAIRHGLLQAES
ncbi:response regulator [bacterium]|nr:response regulator [bacterium]